MAVNGNANGTNANGTDARESNHAIPAGLDPLVVRAISADLVRLDQILHDAFTRLSAAFAVVHKVGEAEGLAEISGAAHEAIVALQFQDMATQLIAYCRERLDHPPSAEQIAYDPTATMSFSQTHFMSPPGPVSQNTLAAGSIDLF